MNSHNRRQQASHCLGVLHIPKTGGVALRDALDGLPGCYTGPFYFDKEHFGSVVMTQAIPSPSHERIAKAADLAEIIREHSLVIGHYSTEVLWNAGCVSLAVQFREPRARIISLYRYWQAQLPSVRSSWGRWGSRVIAKADLPFKDFLSSPEVWPAVDNAMARQTLRYNQAEGHHAIALGSGVEATYSEFVSTLAAADWSCHSESFLERLCEHIGVSAVPDLGRANSTEVAGEEIKIDDATFELLRHLTRMDSLLLEGLMSDGLLPRRSAADLDSEFETAATKLGFQLGG